MIALAWGVIGAITLYAFRVYSEKSEQVDTSTYLEAARSIKSPSAPFGVTNSGNTNRAWMRWRKMERL